MLGYCAGGLLLVLGVVVWARRAAQDAIAPLAELTDVARKIAGTGDLDIAVPRITAGEVGQLANAFAVMVDTLRAAEATLESKVAQRTEQLRQSEAAAEAANRAKSRFLATMSHEIRTPMNSILGMAQILLLPDLDAGERRDYARTILNSGQTLLTLLNDILDLSKVEAGKYQLESAPFEPSQLIHEIELLFGEAAKSKQLQLDAQWNGPPRQRYLGDANRLRQMLANLLGNAIKFTERGTVRVEVAEISRHDRVAQLEFAVRDTGIGIPADKLGLLFQPFSQTDTSTTRKYGGSGLGLSIVDGLAKLMGGQVGVVSEEGQGSRFCFVIPAEILAAGEDGRAQPRSIDLPSWSPGLRGRVLVVEDHPANRQLVDTMLRKLGLTVTMVDDGQQAVTAITGGDPVDLVLMDVQMPVLDGYAATERIRQWETDHQRPRLPIVALTADAFAEDRQRCLAAGMDEVLTKPIVMNALKAVLDRYLWRDAATLTAPPVADQAVDRQRLLVQLEAIMPLLAQSRFDAIIQFKEIVSLVAGTESAAEIGEIGALLAACRFDVALARLRDFASGLKPEEEER